VLIPKSSWSIRRNSHLWIRMFKVSSRLQVLWRWWLYCMW